MNVTQGYTPPANGYVGAPATGVLTIRNTDSSTASAALYTLTGLDGTSPMYAGGPGDSGSIQMFFNGSVAVSRDLSAAGTATITSSKHRFTVSNNVSYPASTPGFWKVFGISSASGEALPGWNSVYFGHTESGSTPTLRFAYDNSFAAPIITATSVAPLVIPEYSHASGIPHFASGSTFTLGFDVAGVCANYYAPNPNIHGDPTGAFSTPASITDWTALKLAGVAVTEPSTDLARGTTYTAVTTVGLKDGFGADATKPSLIFNNGYASAAASFASVGYFSYLGNNATINYKTSATGIVETAISSTGFAAPYRILLAGDATPVQRGLTFVKYLSSTRLTDAAHVAEAVNYKGQIMWSKADFSTCLPPGGPNYTGHATVQYFTFVFPTNSTTQKYTVTILSSTGITGYKTALPGSAVDDAPFAINGWVDGMFTLASGAVPGTVDAGCASGIAIPKNTPLGSSGIGTSYLMTFGPAQATAANSYNVYVRIALASGQTISALSVGVAA